MTIPWLRVVISLILVWATYHLVRDILQDLLFIHHPFFDIFHQPIKREVGFLGPLNNYWSIPLELAIIFIATSCVTETMNKKLVFATFTLTLLFLIIWLWTTV